jgi:hypothetical protein
LFGFVATLRLGNRVFAALESMRQIDQDAARAWILLQNLGKNLSVTSADIHDLLCGGKIIGFEQSSDMQHRKRGHWTVEEPGQFGITLQPLENIFAACQLMMALSPDVTHSRKSRTALVPVSPPKKKGSTVQGPWHVALEKLAWQRQDKTII